MRDDMLIRDLFLSDVTRDIPPVVYFHEQGADKLDAEVSEYIITGGWPEDHPNHRRVPSGIHEQYVRLLTNIAAELDKAGGPELPNAWISGFYGSGKSSFAKLLGLSLDGVALPDGGSLAEAWLQRDTSPKSAELREAWRVLRQKIDPLAVVFDIGGIARDNEHIHAATVRQVQRRLDYCSTEPLVADFELRLERDGEWARFEKTAQETLGTPWAGVKDKALAEEDFSLVMSVMYPNRYTDPMSWFTSRGGTHARSDSPEEAVAAIRDMLQFRRPRATLFLVVDEVSQYVLSNKDRVDRLRAFATAIGSTLRGKAWLLALGQQKLDEEADDSFLVWAKDRFPPKLRVHLAATNIRDVVHKRLLQKRPDAEGQLRALFESHRPDLKLYAYGCEAVTPEEFVEVYPMLPGQIDLILQITSALRTRSARAQGDDQAIRGLLQLLGELFRDQKLAEQPVGALVTLDRIYEVQHTALDSDVQASMARVLSQCTDDADGLMVRAAKAVALLELIQDTRATDAKLVAQCLYDRVDRGNHVAAVTEALEELRRRNLLGYSEKHGYKVQSSAGEEWERERRDIGVVREAISEIVQDGLTFLLAAPDRPRLQGRPFPWAGQFSDGRRADDVNLVDPRDDAAARVDFRFLAHEERTESTWVKKSGETALHDRLVWLCGDSDNVDHHTRELYRSRAMVKKYKPRRESLNPARKILLQQEENRAEDLEKLARDAIATAWMAGKMYFRGRSISPQEQGASFAAALHATATRVLPDLFPHFIATQVQPSELLQLVEAELSGPSPKFLTGDLGILELDSGRYVPSCSGVVANRIQEHIESEGGLGGTTLLAHFGGPPYGYTANVVKACVAGLLRAGKVRLQPDGGNEITAIRDAGVRDLFDKDRAFRRTTIFPAGEDDIGFQARARICRFFEERLRHRMDREDHAIADAVAQHFPQLAQKLRDVQGRLNQLPGSPEGPVVFRKLGEALEQCIRTCRQTKPTVKLVKKHLDTLQDGVQLLQLYDAELAVDAIRAVAAAHGVLTYQATQLKDLGVELTKVEAAAKRVAAQLEAERPWRDIGALDEDLAEIRNCYLTERQRLLQWQEQQAETARARVKARDGFSTLTGEQSHRVLRPFALAVTDTTAEAIAPPLVSLKDPFAIALQRAEDQANDLLDEILSEGEKPLIARVDLHLRNREVATEADVQALVDEIKKRLLEQVRAGARVRLL
ncbi:BREX system P-loop protein BrxC [Micromonospora sp. NPDC005806]|uniref:BREX system P-loop protein BrxC n=1 Tax=Micromonospora sp. NPDC005806 TaxID=3364234 RepID=UPI0036C5F231